MSELPSDVLRKKVQAAKDLLETEPDLDDHDEYLFRVAASAFLLRYYLGGKDFYGDRDYIRVLIMSHSKKIERYHA